MERRTRAWLLFLVLAPWLLLGGVGIAVYKQYNRPVPSEPALVTAKPSEASQAANLPWPAASQAAIGTMQDGVLASNGAQTPAPTASTTKIMTAYAILRKKPLAPGQQGPVITITDRDLEIYEDYFRRDGSLVRIAAGEKITEYQALQALMLPSGNNMADTLANWAFGSVEEYTKYANELAKELGLNQTTIRDASGFSPQTVSTATDLLKLVQAARKNPVFAEIVSQRTADIPVAGTIYNTNWLLGQEGITGVKTGNTLEAGGVFTFSATKQIPEGGTTEIIGAVMGAPTIKQAIESAVPLVNSTAQNYVVKEVLKRGQVMGVYDLPWSDKTVKAVARDDAKMTVFSGSTVKTEVKLKPISDGARKGTEVGTVALSAGSQKYVIPVILESAAPKPTPWWRLTHK